MLVNFLACINIPISLLFKVSGGGTIGIIVWINIKRDLEHPKKVQVY